MYYLTKEQTAPFTLELGINKRMSLLQYYIQTERTVSSTCLLVILEKNNTLLNFHYYRKKTAHCIFTRPSTLLPDNKFLI